MSTELGPGSSGERSVSRLKIGVPGFRGNPFVGRWVKCLEESRGIHAYVVDVRPDGTAEEVRIFDSDGASLMQWDPLDEASAGPPAMEFWGDFDHGCYRSELVRDEDRCWRLGERTHSPNDSQRTTLSTTCVVFVPISSAG